MELVTSWERKGLAEGLHNGINALLLIRFGNVGLLLYQEIEDITDPILLKAILTRLTTASTLDEVRLLYASSDD